MSKPALRRDSLPELLGDETISPEYLAGLIVDLRDTQYIREVIAALERGLRNKLWAAEEAKPKKVKAAEKAERDRIWQEATARGMRRGGPRIRHEEEPS
jgi:hypothetical protein